jgi:hypothetical protein
LLGWAGEAAADAANYIGDAPFSRYSLIGGPRSDWTQFFGSMQRMDLALPVADVVRIIAVGLMLVGVAIAIFGWTREVFDAASRHSSRDAAKPVF